MHLEAGSGTVKALLQYQEAGKVRLGWVRTDYRNGNLDLDGVKALYDTWVHQDEGMVLQLQFGSAHGFAKRTFGRKLAKRGNDVYRWRAGTRLDSLKAVLPSFGITLTEGTTNALFLTLTDNPALSDTDLAWETIGERWNRFLSAIRKRYGKVDFVRSWESTERGRPHIHALVVFHESTFSTFTDARGALRIMEKREFEGYWDSFVDVQAPRSAESCVGYITKEVLKHTVDYSRGSTTLALLWLHRKRAFSISKGIQAAIRRLDTGTHNSNQVSRALDLMGIPIDDMKDAKWVFIGVCSWSEVLAERLPGQKDELWSYELKRAPKIDSVRARAPILLVPDSPKGRPAPLCANSEGGGSLDGQG